MALLSPEQVASAQKANLDAFFGLSGKVFEGVEKLIALNLQAIKSTLVEAQENAATASGTNDPQQWLASQAGVTGPCADKWRSFGRQLLDITSTTQAEVTQLARAQYELYNARVQTLVEDAAKSAPAGSEAAIAAWKSAISATSTWHDTLQKTGQQAMQVAGSNLAAVTAAASSATRRAIGQASTVASAKR